MTSSASRLYRATLATGMLVALGVLVATTRGLAGLAIERPSLAELTGACAGLLGDLTPARIAAIALAGLSTAIVLLAARSAVAVVAADRAVRSACRGARRETLAGQPVVVLAGAEPRAFCVGLRQPAIVMTTGALALLSPASLDAVVAHEAQHARRRDPLRLAVIRVVADALFFLPILRRAAARHATLAEIGADEAAAHSAGRPAVARALIAFGDDAGPDRVDALLGRPSRFTLSASIVLGTFATMLALGAVAATGASTDASGTARTCVVAVLALPVGVGIAAFLRPTRPRRP